MWGDFVEPVSRSMAIDARIEQQRRSAADHLHTACLALWSAVLAHAVQEARGLVMKSGLNPSERGLVQARARRWIASEETGRASYLWVCDQLDLNPRVVREAVFAEASDDGARG